VHDGGSAALEPIEEFMRASSGHLLSGVGTEDDVIQFGLDFPKQDLEDGWASFEHDSGWSAYCEMSHWWF
jgi:hypothetical protein